MKNNFTVIYKVFFFSLLTILFISNSGGPPTGNTGAPGDGACNNCHSGGTQTGSVDITGILDIDNPILPNKTYNVTVGITLATGSSSRAGFQFVALEGNSAGSPSIGTLSNFGTNVGTATSGSRTYAQHSGGENTYVGSVTTYTFDWTSPATSTNNISFYVAANIADGSGTGGDLIVFDSDQNISLPVELVDFNVKDVGNGQVELNWSTASEINSDYFEVLRSENGRDYNSLGKVFAAGFSNQMQYYSFQDDAPIENRYSFYRLKQFDLDGSYTYSSIEAVQVMNYQDHYLNIFPNPARNNECLFIDYISATSHPNAHIRIYDQFGRSVFDDPQMHLGIQKGFNKFVLDLKNIPNGQYFLSISDNGNLLKGSSFIMVNN
jgi:hypothetical protein